MGGYKKHNDRLMSEDELREVFGTKTYDDYLNQFSWIRDRRLESSAENSTSNNQSMFDVLSEREWEMFKMYVQKRMYAKDEKFSYKELGSQAIFFIDSLKMGIINGIANAKKEEKTNEVVRQRKEAERAEEERIEKLSSDEKLAEGKRVNFESLSEEMQAKVKASFFELALKDNKFKNHYAWGGFVSLAVYGGFCRIPSSLADSWQKEYLSTLTTKEKLQQNYQISWEECDEELKEKLYTSFFAKLTRSAHTKNGFIANFKSKDECFCFNIPYDILNEWYTKGTNKLNEMSEGAKWQNHWRFDYNKMTQEEKDNFYKELLLIINLTNSGITGDFLMKKCNVPKEIYTRNRSECRRINN